jgi:hypothetical protein
VSVTRLPKGIKNRLSLTLFEVSTVKKSFFGKKKVFLHSHFWQIAKFPIIPVFLYARTDAENIFS